jgi:queuine/archaeosine tRNA-ribosyltransferase
MTETKIVHESKKLSRVLEVSVSNKILTTPTYFPAISSLGTKFSSSELLLLLTHHKYPRALVSAYDLHHQAGREDERKQVLNLIKRYRTNGLLFLDSGLFESSWKDDPEWNIDVYKSVLSEVHFDLYTSFDVYRNEAKSYEDFKKRTYSNAVESSVFLDNLVFYVILHESSPFQLLKLMKEFVEDHHDLCGRIAIAERDIGKSIQERTETVIAARRMLNEDDPGNLLHILGCGNPLSMLLYSYCGADTYDSLDWLKSAINPSNYLLYDLSHLILIHCNCQVCTEPPYRDADYSQKVLLHNLLFYQNFIMQLQSLIRNDNLEAYLREHFGDNFIDQIDEY